MCRDKKFVCGDFDFFCLFEIYVRLGLKILILDQKQTRKIKSQQKNFVSKMIHTVVVYIHLFDYNQKQL